ncbi:hypothetical protein Gorai_019358 [Gossypium raimondii]|uniref:Uncharacterized protein n=2 Tax=Gossypium TaxID=3633 RepID=A0A7J8PP63_GOSRA|nr:hypothetical protein [Gossypium raimondii]MBA0653776.1 hypothetical protein [Gossypium klotzschianum]
MILQETALHCGKSGFLTGRLLSSSYRNPTQHLLTHCASMPPTNSDNTDCGIATQIFIVMVMSSTLWVSAIILGIGSLLMFSEIQGILPTCQQPHGRLNTISKMLTRKETTLSN